MESKLRHDLRHPLATIAMISSTMAAFADGIDDDTVQSYLAQVAREMSDLSDICTQNDIRLNLSVITEATGRFTKDPRSMDAASALEVAAQTLMDQLTAIHVQKT